MMVKSNLQVNSSHLAPLIMPKLVFTGSVSRLGKDQRLNWTGPEKTENMKTSKDQECKRPHKDHSK